MGAAEAVVGIADLRRRQYGMGCEGSCRLTPGMSMKRDAYKTGKSVIDVHHKLRARDLGTRAQVIDVASLPYAAVG